MFVCLFMFIQHIPCMKVWTSCRSWLSLSCGSWALNSGHELRTGASAFTWWTISLALHLPVFSLAFSYCSVPYTLPRLAFPCSLWIWGAGLLASSLTHLGICCLKAPPLSWLILEIQWSYIRIHSYPSQFLYAFGLDAGFKTTHGS